MGINITHDGSLAFICLGPANQVAVVDARTYAVKTYLLVGQRVWHADLTADDKQLFTANGVTGDVSVIDIPSLTVVKSILVGAFPWGVAVSPK